MIEDGAQCVLGEHYFPAARGQAETLRLDPQLSTINPQLLYSGNRVLLQRAATATLWNREAGTRVSKVRTGTGKTSASF
jgi:hypothetical protein